MKELADVYDKQDYAILLFLTGRPKEAIHILTQELGKLIDLGNYDEADTISALLSDMLVSLQKNDASQLLGKVEAAAESIEDMVSDEEFWRSLENSLPDAASPEKFTPALWLKTVADYAFNIMQELATSGDTSPAALVSRYFMDKAVSMLYEASSMAASGKLDEARELFAKAYAYYIPVYIYITKKADNRHLMTASENMLRLLMLARRVLNVEAPTLPMESLEKIVDTLIQAGAEKQKQQPA